MAMTGEITLRGEVLPVGGIKEKVLAARRAGVRVIIMPALNERDLEDVSKDLRKDMEFVFVEKVRDVLSHAIIPKRTRASTGPKTTKRNAAKRSVKKTSRARKRRD
jgi:ATP-dependent Lon protease